MFNFFSKKRAPQQLWFSTDIHCHILPGIDDGSPDVETSVDLVERMQAWGIKRIIASPHVTDMTFPNTHETIAKAREELQSALSAKGNKVELSNSAEYRIDDLFMAHLADGTLINLPGNHLLVENSFMQEPWDLDNLLFELQVKGFQPILVHPERYSYYYTNKERYASIFNGGTKFQINLLSLTGYYGKDEKRIAEYLIEHSMVNFIGSDIHRHSHADQIDAYLASKDYERHRAALEACTLNDTL